MLRPAARPDEVPSARPRRAAAAQAWSREAAWEAVQQRNPPVIRREAMVEDEG